MFLLVLSLGLSARKENVEYHDEGLFNRSRQVFTSEELDSLTRNSESHEYQAEISKLLNILIDSLYQNKDIFMRELISNANDALDKVRFQALKNPSILDNGPKELEIYIDVNEDEKTVSITDTGIGMTKNELIENLGRIAKSGTYDFQKMLQSGDTNLIGQFGVGFYSSFLVAKSVIVISKSNNDPKQWIWKSDGTSNFNVVEDPRGNTLGRGTSIILQLKDSCYNYVDRDRLISIIRHYSMFVDFPVKMWHHQEIFVDEDVEQNPFDQVEGVSDDDSEDKKTQTTKKTVWQWYQVNNRKPIWLRDPSEITESEYNEFYSMFYKDSKPALYHTHFKAEGRVGFNALFYIPSIPPPDDKLFETTTRNVRLYVKRVLVSDEWNDELLPNYLHFMKGVIDSNDLTLSVDRDRLAKTNTLKLIKRRVTSKLLSTFRHIFLYDPKTYSTFYKLFGGNLKYGVVEDVANRRAVSRLLMFYTSYSPKKLTTLDDYVARMKKGQEKIYWIGSEDVDEAVTSPYCEDLYSQGIEVIFGIEPIDIYCLESMEEYDGIELDNPERLKDRTLEEKIQDVSQFNFSQKEFNRYVRWFKRVIGPDKVENVMFSTRLKTTPALCTATSYGYTASHERVLRAQTVHDNKMNENIQMNKKILELNPTHPLVLNILSRVKKNPKDKTAIEDVQVLFDSALIGGGYTLDETLNFTKKVYHMLGRSYHKEDEIRSFENDNEVYIPKIEDEFELEHKNAKRVHLGKGYKYGGDAKDDGEEAPAQLHPDTPKELYEGLI